MSSALLLEDEVANEVVTATRVRVENELDSGPAEQSLSESSSRWIKPSPFWMLALTMIAAISTSGTVAPRVEIYTRTICRAYGLDQSPALCDVNREVQAAAAQLMAIIGTALGALSMITAAWWGSLSDAYGRIWVLGFNVGGLMVSDTVFLIVAHFWEKLPGTFWWFILGPVVEGLVGGISVASIVMHAYISDCSDPTARSRAFSRLMGLLFVGMSIGPLLSGYIMRTTGQVLPVFYATTAIDALVTLGVWIVMPESLSVSEMKHHRTVRANRLRSTGPGILGRLRRVGHALNIAAPLSVLLPRKVELGSGKWSVDWTMSILGAGYGFGTIIQASTVQQIQYSYVKFGWTADVISYWLGATHITKAIYLTFVFPAIVRLLAWIRERPSGDVRESEPLLSANLDGPQRHGKKASPMASLDLLLARVAIITDLVFYVLVFSTGSGVLFALFTMGISLGTGFGPTTQSLALSIYGQHGGTDTGALLGALTVVSALSAHVVGPAVFGITYMKTVTGMPGAFFLVGCAALTVSLVLLMFVRLGKDRYRISRECRGTGATPQNVPGI